jgi:KDO2-lipid IV(A) lauroyltransferase
MSWLHTFLNYIGLSILRLFAFLPYAWTVQIGYALGYLFGRLPHQRKYVVLRNLQLCFPNLTSHQIQTLANEHWRLLGRAVIERSRVWLGSANQIFSLVDIERFPTLLVLNADLWHFLPLGKKMAGSAARDYIKT